MARASSPSPASPSRLTINSPKQRIINGIRQFIHDIIIDSGGVIRVKAVEALGDFSTTRAAIQDLSGNEGDLGVTNVNGHTTSFTQGHSGPATLYQVILQAAAVGGPVHARVVPAVESKFADSTPEGLKIGHTGEYGNPSSSEYASATVALTVTTTVPPDQNADGDVDGDDVDLMRACASGPDVPHDPGCEDSDLDGDGDVDQMDFRPAQLCISGENVDVDPDCYVCDE